MATRIAEVHAYFVRHYSDTGQTKAYCCWRDTRGLLGRTEGEPDSAHMLALKARAERENVPVFTETW